MARSSAARAKEVRAVRAKPVAAKQPVKVRRTSKLRMSSKPVARGVAAARVGGSGVGAIAGKKRGGRDRAATSTSISPGRSGNALKVSYVALAQPLQGPVTATSVRVAAIPPGQETIDEDQLAPTLNFQTVGVWSLSGLSAMVITFSAPPSPLYPDPFSDSWTMFQLRVTQGGVVTQIKNERCPP